MEYRREIDGLRAIAIIPVILFHAGFDIFKGGFLGVDIFFVISGYLITTIILLEKDKKNFSLINFYERRARRILPTLFFVIMVSLPFAWLWLLPTDHKDYSQSIVAVPFFSSNILFFFKSGYFDSASEMKPLLHTWSLAVEEQFYLLFPLLLMLFYHLRKKWIFCIIIILGIISFIFSQWRSYFSSNFIFYMLLTRAWEIIAGALSAFYLLYFKNNYKIVKKNYLFKEIIGGLGLGLILVGIFFYNAELEFSSLFLIFSVLGTVLIILYSSRTTITGKFLGTKVLVGIGLISYSLYLWHQPVLAFSRHRSIESQSFLEITLLIVFIGFISYLSWMYIEKPFRIKKGIKRSDIFIFSIIGSLFFIITGSIGYFKNGFDDREFWFQNLLLYEFDNRKLQNESWNILRKISNNINYNVENNNYDNQLWFDMQSIKKKLLLVGNSHSKDIFNVLYNSELYANHYQLARYGVQIRNLKDINHIFYFSQNYLASEVIILATRFNSQDVESLPVIIQKMKSDGKKIILVKRIFDFESNEKKFKNLADFELLKWCSDSCQHQDPSRISKKINEAYFENFMDLKYKNSESIKINNMLDEVANKYNIKTLNRMDYICEEKQQQCYAINDQFEKYFYDYGHHTLRGAKFFGAIVEKNNWIKLEDI